MNANNSAWCTSSTSDIDLGQLFVRHQAAVLGNLLRWGVQPADAPDLCADAFLVAMQRLPTFAGDSSISTWLLGIAKNLASDYRRSSRSRREVLVDAVPEQAVPGEPDELLQRTQQASVVRRAVAELKPSQRAVVTGYVLEEQPMNVVAMKQRVPTQTAYARLYAAHHALRTALEPLQRAA